MTKRKYEELSECVYDFSKALRWGWDQKLLTLKNYFLANLQIQRGKYSNLESLPNSIKTLICTFVGPYDAATLSRTCKDLYASSFWYRYQEATKG